MAFDWASGLIGLGGAVIGASATLLTQYSADRRTRASAAKTERARRLSAMTLVAQDLERSLHRLENTRQGDPRGFMELPRGAWREYRSILAPALDAEVLAAVLDAYNKVVEWNEILWTAFARSPPDSHHGSDQYSINAEQAGALLVDRRDLLMQALKDAERALATALAEGDLNA